jgi:hypothetical protein
MSFSISGNVATLAGVTITAYTYPTGVNSGSATTNGSGNYTISGLANGEYTVTAVETGYSIAPASSAQNPLLSTNQTAGSPVGVQIVGANVTGINFTANATAVNDFFYAGTSGTAVTSLSTGSWGSYQGNPIIVFSTNGSTPTDTLNNNYIADGGGWFHAISKGNGSGGTASNAVTISFPSSSYVALISYELVYSPAGTFAFITQDTNTSSSGTSISSNSLSTLAANAFTAALFWANSGANATGVSGLLTALDHNGTAFANSVGHGFVFNGAQTGVDTFTQGSSYTTGHIFSGVYGWLNNGIRGNCGVGGATVSFSGPRSGSVTANLDGSYYIPFAAAGDVATFTITPSASGVTFSPSSQTTTPSTLATDVTGVSFTGSTTITSSVTSAVTDSTIVLEWTTAGISDSNAYATGDVWTNKPALDNGLPCGETSHVAIITDLKPSTTYSVYVESLGTQSSPINVTTAPAQARFLITGGTYGSVVQGVNGGGDTFHNIKSNDGNTYTTQDDGTGLDGLGLGNVLVCQLTDPTTVAGTTINSLSGFGTNNSYDGQDSPVGGESTKKVGGGIFSIAGNLFLCVARQALPAQNYVNYRVQVLKSTDKGVTWANSQNPTVAYAGGREPSPIFAYSFGNFSFGFASFVKHGVDDGTLGYNTAGNQIDGANGYVYQTIKRITALGSTTWDSAIYLMRTPRRAFNQLLVGPGYSTYWAGPTSPTAQDFVTASNWVSSSNPAGLTGMLSSLSAPDTLYWHNVEFIPRLNSYVVLTFAGNLLAAPTPAGPWSAAISMTNAPSSTTYQGEMLLHGDAASNTAAQNIAITGTLNGTNGQPFYGAATVPITFTTSTYPISGNCGAGGATVSWTGTASGSVVADALGNYVTSNLANGAYTLTPSLTGYTFSPLSSSQTVSNADITSVNFTESSISGNGTGSNNSIYVLGTFYQLGQI